MQFSNPRQLFAIARELPPKSKTWLTDWHHLLVIVHLTEAVDYFMLESVNLDGMWYPIRQKMPYFNHIVAPGGWGNNETMMLETANVHTGCSNGVTHKGISVFDNVKATFYPW